MGNIISKMGRKSWQSLCHIPCRTTPATESRCPSPELPLLTPSARAPASQPVYVVEQATFEPNDKFSLDSLHVMSVETASSAPISTLSMSSMATEWTYQSEQGDESESVRLFVVDIIERAKQQVIHDGEKKPENPVYSFSSSAVSVSETADSTASKPQTRISSARSRISLDS